MAEHNQTTTPREPLPAAPVEPQNATIKPQVLSKRKRVNEPKSKVWAHYEGFLNADGSRTGEAQCTYCKKIFACSSTNGTTTLKRHTEKCKKYPYKGDKKQQLLSFTAAESLSNWKFDQEHCRKLFARMIIVDELPFSFVEKEGFKTFMNAAQPRFKLLSRTTTTKDCVQLYAEERKKLKEMFESSNSRVSLTTDLWTSVQNLGYMCLTAHFIDKDWVLQKRIINFRVVPTPHRGEVIAQAVETCLLDWGIKKLCTLTVDNASSNDTAATSLVKRFSRRNSLLLDGDFFHVRCFAHVLNLIVKDGLNNVSTSLARLRAYVKFVRSSPSRLEAFKKCAREERIASKKHLCLDVQTRWNSTYMMLNAALDFQSTFERLHDQDANFSIEFKREDEMTNDDWSSMKNLSKFLEHFYIVTKRVSGSHYTTSNSYFLEVNMIQTLLSKWTKSDDAYFRDMALKMQSKFDKYCNIDKVNTLLIIAVVLDPRYKLKYVKWCYAKFYESKKVIDIIAKVQDLSAKLYQFYLLENTETLDTGYSQSSNVSSLNEVEELIEEESSGWDNFLREEEITVKSELERYLEESVESNRSDFDILGWWKEKSTSYRILSCMARDILAIPISTVASESAFSTGGRVLDQFRSSLTPKIVESLICAQDWLRNSPAPVEIEEKLEILEELEAGVADIVQAFGSGVSCTTET